MGSESMHRPTKILRDMQSVLGAGVGWWGGGLLPQNTSSMKRQVADPTGYEHSAPSPCALP